MSRPSRAFHIPGKVQSTHGHRLHGQPRQPLPGHTRKITFVTMISALKFSLRLELVVCRDFTFLIFIREVFSLSTQDFIPTLTQKELALIPIGLLQLRVYQLTTMGHSCPDNESDCRSCPRFYTCFAENEEWFRFHVELTRRRNAK